MLRFNAHFGKRGCHCHLYSCLRAGNREKTTVLPTEQVSVLVSFELKDLKYIWRQDEHSKKFSMNYLLIKNIAGAKQLRRIFIFFCCHSKFKLASMSLNSFLSKSKNLCSFTKQHVCACTRFPSSPLLNV